MVLTLPTGCVALAFGTLTMLATLAPAAAASPASAQDPSNVQCADEAARAVISTMGGRSRITTMLMSFVKCLQRSHNELFKLIADILEETSTCANKSDMLDVIKCMSVDPPAKKISALVMKSADIVKCAVE